MIPFYKPFIDRLTEEAVLKALRSGWLSSGPLVREFENELKKYTGAHSVVCTGSAGMSLQLILKKTGIGTGDEVILPAFTHPATANAVVLCGATPIFADIREHDMCIDPHSVENLITKKTKAIIAVDIAGFPSDYTRLLQLSSDKKHLFSPSSETQKHMERIPVIADASHSFGSEISGEKSGILADLTVFSFHAVKNLTTGEGAAICIHFSDQNLCNEFADFFNAARVHGLNADAWIKLERKTWEYDVTEPSGKTVMTDVEAAIGLCDIQRYDSVILPARFRLFNFYNNLFANDKRFLSPFISENEKTGNGHLYILRINGYSADQRNQLMKTLYKNGIITNLQYVPIPLLSWYRNNGFTIKGLENTMKVFNNCISLPIYHELSEQEQTTVCNSLKNFYSLMPSFTP
jgi:dTDP-4-amino-4,6-dideoxygalactose transaminase